MRNHDLSEADRELLRRAGSIMGKLYGAIGGRKSRRSITPEQQAAMQEGRKKTKRILTPEQQAKMQEGRRKRRHLNYAQAPAREVRL